MANLRLKNRPALFVKCLQMLLINAFINMVYNLNNKNRKVETTNNYCMRGRGGGGRKRMNVSFVWLVTSIGRKERTQSFKVRKLNKDKHLKENKDLVKLK